MDEPLLPMPGTQQWDDSGGYIDTDDDDDDDDDDFSTSEFSWRVFLENVCRVELECNVMEMTRNHILAQFSEIIMIDFEHVASETDNGFFLIAKDTDAQFTAWFITARSMLVSFISLNEIDNEDLAPIETFRDGDFIIYERSVIEQCADNLVQKRNEIYKDDGQFNENSELCIQVDDGKED